MMICDRRIKGFLQHLTRGDHLSPPRVHPPTLQRRIASTREPPPRSASRAVVPPYLRFIQSQSATPHLHSLYPGPSFFSFFLNLFFLGAVKWIQLCFDTPGAFVQTV